jgi:hypothetical protein
MRHRYLLSPDFSLVELFLELDKRRGGARLLLVQSLEPLGGMLFDDALLAVLLEGDLERESVGWFRLFSKCC